MLVIIIAAVVLLAGGGGGAFIMMSGGGEAADGEHGEHVEEVHEEVHLATVELEPFIVNLSEQTSFLKLKILVEYDPEVFNMGHDHGGGGAYGGGGSGGGGGDAEGGMPAPMLKREPMIRDAVIRVISGKTPSQVLSLEGKEQLKEELLEAINEAIGLDEPAVINLYFIEFIIQ
ncbi:MAG: flagellar basal body-associated FliL family protein [Bdellovibrionota bacterium]